MRQLKNVYLNISRRLMRMPTWQKAIVTTVTLCVALMGVWLLTIGAQNFFTDVEPESGKLKGGARVVDDAGASGGKAIQFNTSQPPAPSPAPPTPTSPAPESGVRGAKLYVHPRLSEEGRPAPISSQPIAHWVGDWTPNVRGEIHGVVTTAAARGEMPVFVAYNIPARDCGLYSAGGAGSSAAYRAWIREFAAGIGQRKAIVILEPDALAGMDCMSAGDQNTRIADLVDAVNALKAYSQAFVYLDAGNSGWHPAEVIADRLSRANIANAQGFALNVSNFISTSETAAFADKLAVKLGGKRYVIDTSRNGQGRAPDHAWCNPPGRGLGARPTTSPGIGQYADAHLWIKVPGESDGSCDGAPEAGHWYEAYAQELIRNAVY